MSDYPGPVYFRTIFDRGNRCRLEDRSRVVTERVLAVSRPVALSGVVTRIAATSRRRCETCRRERPRGGRGIDVLVERLGERRNDIGVSDEVIARFTATSVPGNFTSIGRECSVADDGMAGEK